MNKHELVKEVEEDLIWSNEVAEGNIVYEKQSDGTVIAVEFDFNGDPIHSYKVLIDLEAIS